MKKYFFRRHHTWVLWLVLLTISALISACKTESTLPTTTPLPTETLTSTITPTQVATLRPTATPTLPALGNIDNPVTIGFILGQSNQTSSAAEELTNLLSQSTGYEMEALLYPDFGSLASAIMNGDVDLYWLNPLEYLYLSDQGYAMVMLMTNHQGVYSYGVQFITNINSGFSSFFDPQTGETTDDILNALQQFSGTRPCFISPDSIPGYYIPSGLLTNTSTPTLDPVFTYNYNATIRALYISGICDFGVTYALTGDPLTSSDILINLTDAEDRIEVIWRSEGLIPNLNLSASPNLPVFMRFRFEEALLHIAEDMDGLNLISAALDYQVEGLQSVEDHFYNPFRSVILPLALDLEAITYETTLP